MSVSCSLWLRLLTFRLLCSYWGLCLVVVCGECQVILLFWHSQRRRKGIFVSVFLSPPPPFTTSHYTPTIPGSTLYFLMRSLTVSIAWTVRQASICIPAWPQIWPTPAEFSSNPNHTHLSMLIRVFKIIRQSQAGEIDQELNSAAEKDSRNPDLTNLTGTMYPTMQCTRLDLLWWMNQNWSKTWFHTKLLKKHFH